MLTFAKPTCRNCGRHRRLNGRGKCDQCRPVVKPMKFKAVKLPVERKREPAKLSSYAIEPSGVFPGKWRVVAVVVRYGLRKRGEVVADGLSEQDAEKVVGGFLQTETE